MKFTECTRAAVQAEFRNYCSETRTKSRPSDGAKKKLKDHGDLSKIADSDAENN